MRFCSHFWFITDGGWKIIREPTMSICFIPLPVFCSLLSRCSTWAELYWDGSLVLARGQSPIGSMGSGQLLPDFSHISASALGANRSTNLSHSFSSWKILPIGSFPNLHFSERFIIFCRCFMLTAIYGTARSSFGRWSIFLLSFARSCVSAPGHKISSVSKPNTLVRGCLVWDRKMTFGTHKK